MAKNQSSKASVASSPDPKYTVGSRVAITIRKLTGNTPKILIETVIIGIELIELPDDDYTFYYSLKDDYGGVWGRQECDITDRPMKMAAIMEVLDG
jgi:hypothetical protein